MSSDQWLGILKWTKWPHFDHIHDMSPRDLEANYYISPSLDEVIDNLYSCLLTGRSISDKLLIGMPGCGKTTFIYYLSKVPHFRHKHALTERYHFEVIHINRLVSSSLQESEAAAVERCLEIYRRFFIACGLADEFSVIITNKLLTNRDKINKCLDIIVRDKASLPKKLLVVIDDIDEANERIVWRANLCRGGRAKLHRGENGCVTD